MRFAKFFFALIFGAVFLMTLFKVLFFLLIGAGICGLFFLATRAFGYRRMYGRRQWSNYQPYMAHEPFLQQNSPFEQPLSPNWQKRPGAVPFGRRIEVK